MSAYKAESYAYLHYHVTLCNHIDLRRTIYAERKRFPLSHDIQSYKKEVFLNFCRDNVRS